MSKCLIPFIVHDKVNHKAQLVPCGHCINCCNRKISSWAFRLNNEAKFAETALFVTLTYDDCHLRRSVNGYANLCKRDVQLFFKRFRRSGQYIKYYCVGEYGSRYMRPHYHIILFNAYFDSSFIIDGKTLNAHSCWQNGHVVAGMLTPAAVNYTLKYISKPRSLPAFFSDDRLAPFSLMSKGLGSCYLSPSIINYHRSYPVDRFNCILQGGYKIALPRYFKKKIFSSDELLSINSELSKLSVITETSVRDRYEAYLSSKRKFENLIISPKL